MNNNDQLDMAIRLAANAHFGQKRFDGSPYILHPLWVMDRVSGAREKIVAVLHDVLEDTPVTKGSLSLIFDSDIIDSLVAITRPDGEDYSDYINRVDENLMARIVKPIDLIHNMMKHNVPESKMKWFVEKRIPRYQRALTFLRRNRG